MQYIRVGSLVPAKLMHCPEEQFGQGKPESVEATQMAVEGIVNIDAKSIQALLVLVLKAVTGPGHLHHPANAAEIGKIIIVTPNRDQGRNIESKAPKDIRVMSYTHLPGY